MRIVVLTGAGISAESGVPTFRDADGLWEGHRVEDVATPGGVRRPADGRAPVLRRPPGGAGRGRAQPRAPRAGPARGARSATTCSSSPRTSTTCTSGPARPRVLHMHGELLLGAVPRLRRAHAAGPTTSATTRRARTAGSAELRPGRRLVRRDPLRDGPDPRRARPAPTCSSRSAPRARSTRPPASCSTPPAHGARTLELNLQPSEGTHHFDEARHGPAGELVPAWVDSVLG